MLPLPMQQRFFNLKATMTPENTRIAADNIWKLVQSNALTGANMYDVMGDMITSGSLTLEEAGALLSSDFSRLPDQASYTGAARRMTSIPPINQRFPFEVEEFRYLVNANAGVTKSSMAVYAQLHDNDFMPSPEQNSFVRDARNMFEFFQSYLPALSNRDVLFDKDTRTYQIGKGDHQSFLPVLSIQFTEDYRYYPNADSGIFYCNVIPEQIIPLSSDSRIHTLNDVLKLSAGFMGPTAPYSYDIKIDIDTELWNLFSGPYEHTVLDKYYMVGPRQFTKQGMQTSPGAFLINSPYDQDIGKVHGLFLPNAMLHYVSVNDLLNPIQ